MALKRIELGRRSENYQYVSDAMDSWPVIQAVNVHGGVFAYTVGAEPYSLARKLNELEGATRFNVPPIADGPPDQRRFDDLCRKGELVGIGCPDRCRVLAYVAPENYERVRAALIALGN
jgi:hypothetical protein